VTYRLELQPDALADIEQAAEWYEQREPESGTAFLREVMAAIDTVQRHPLAYRIRHRRKNIRWKLLDKFPYRVIYQTNDDMITVIAVLHSARHDRNWRIRT